MDASNKHSANSQHDKHPSKQKKRKPKLSRQLTKQHNHIKFPFETQNAATFASKPKALKAKKSPSSWPTKTTPSAEMVGALQPFGRHIERRPLASLLREFVGDLVQRLVDCLGGLKPSPPKKSQLGYCIVFTKKQVGKVNES